MKNRDRNESICAWSNKLKQVNCLALKNRLILQYIDDFTRKNLLHILFLQYLMKTKIKPTMLKLKPKRNEFQKRKKPNSEERTWFSSKSQSMKVVIFAMCPNLLFL